MTGTVSQSVAKETSKQVVSNSGKSSTTKSAVTAAAKTAAAVSKGTGNATALKNAGAAATILK